MLEKHANCTERAVAPGGFKPRTLATVPPTREPNPEQEPQLRVLAQPHGPKGAADDFLVDEEHEGGRQHCLQQLGLQAVEQAPHAIVPERMVK